jgi:hypothetical protein
MVTFDQPPLAGGAARYDQGGHHARSTCGGRVVYALDELKAWADLGTKTSASDPGAGTVLPAKRVVASNHLNGNSNRR